MSYGILGQDRPCLSSPNGWHRCVVMRRLAFISNEHLVGQCEHCHEMCWADKWVGARWYEVGEQWDSRPVYMIEETP